MNARYGNQSKQRNAAIWLAVTSSFSRLLLTTTSTTQLLATEKLFYFINPKFGNRRRVLNHSTDEKV
jgi:hypothetical protein